MKHAHVDATLTTSERLAPWANPAAPECAVRLPRLTRRAIEIDEDGHRHVAPVVLDHGRVVALAATATGGTHADTHR